MRGAYQFGYDDRELQRLGTQHEAWADTNRALLERVGFAPGDTVVDLGCGPDLTTLDLARAVGPSGSVIAVDRDGEKSLPRLMERAAAAGFGNIEARTSDLEDFNTLAVRAGTPGWSWPDSRFRGHLGALVANGYLDRDVLDAFWVDWDHRSHDPSALFFDSPVMESIGRRL